MIFTELPGSITQLLECLCDGNVPLLKSNRRAGSTNFRKPRTHWRLTSYKRRSSGCAAILRVVVSEGHALFADTIDVWCHITNHTVCVTADVRLSDVVAEDDENVG